jgi:hypothetical protein
MPLPKVHEDHASIVLLGNFNPAIFQPAWLAAKGLVRASEAESAKVEIIHPEIAQYRLDWLHVSVQRDRFAVTTTDPARRVSLRDLAIGIFGLLEETPTTKLGLNRTMQVDMKNLESYHALGHLVAPKGPWDGILEKPGLRALVLEAPRTDGAPGRIHFRIEPSQKYPHSAFFDVNSEYHTVPDEDPTPYFMKRIGGDWERVIKDALTGVETLVERAMGSK